MSKPMGLTREAECSQGSAACQSQARGLTREAECSQGVQHVKAKGTDQGSRV